MTTEALRSLLDSLSVEYLHENSFQPTSLAVHDVRRSFYYRRNRREFEALAERYGLKLTEAESPASGLPDLEVRHLGGVLGYALFSRESIPVGGLIGEYTGIVRPERPGRALSGGGYSSDYAWGFPKVSSFGRRLEIDARKAGGILRFANHAPDAAAFPEHFAPDGRWRIIFTALRDISPGEEITVDYGEAYWAGGERELVEQGKRA